MLLAIRTVSKHLSLWGFTPQKSLKKAYEQSPANVKKWLKDDIQLSRRRQNKKMLRSIEAMKLGCTQHERGYASKGKTLIIRLNAKRVSANMISAINN